MPKRSLKIQLPAQRSKAMSHTWSAGGVVVHSKTGKVLVVSQRGDSWSLPKGHIDPGENERQAAEREIAEETGVTKLTFVKELGTYDRFRIKRGGHGEDTDALKTMTFFLYTTDQDDLQPTDPHNPEARWVAPEDVADMLTHQKDKDFFESTLKEVRAVIA